MDDRSEVRRFLDRHGMLAIRFDGLVADLLAEMEAGLAGRASSLAMIPTWLAPVERIPSGDPVLAIDAGGTNFRAALVSFGPDGPAVEGFRSATMPGIAGEIGRDAFFDALAAPVADLAARTGRIGFCFSYPVEILPDLEGRLVHFTKEIRAPEVEGTLVGAGLAEALERAGVRGRRTTVLLNDTTATLLAGRSAAEERPAVRRVRGLHPRHGDERRIPRAVDPQGAGFGRSDRGARERRLRHPRPGRPRRGVRPDHEGPRALPLREDALRRLPRRARAHGGAGRGARGFVFGPCCRGTGAGWTRSPRRT